MVFSRFTEPSAAPSTAILDEQHAKIRTQEYLLELMRARANLEDVESSDAAISTLLNGIEQGTLLIDDAVVQLAEIMKAKDDEASSAADDQQAAAGTTTGKTPPPLSAAAQEQAAYLNATVYGWKHKFRPVSRPAYSFETVERFAHRPNFVERTVMAERGPGAYHPDFHASSTNPPPKAASFTRDKRFQQQKEGRGGTAGGQVPYVGISTAYHSHWYGAPTFDKPPPRKPGLHPAVGEQVSSQLRSKPAHHIGSRLMWEKTGLGSYNVGPAIPPHRTKQRPNGKAKA